MYLVKFSDVVLKTKQLYCNSANLDFLKTIFDYLYEGLNSLSIVIHKKNISLLFIRMLSIDIKNFAKKEDAEKFDENAKVYFDENLNAWTVHVREHTW
jgi:hypothetical protein